MKGRILAGLGVAAVLVGLKFHNKSSTHDEVYAHLMEVCGEDASCTQAVDAHFDACFDESYSIGGRRRSAELDSAGLVGCLNESSGVEHFGMNE